MSFNSKSSPTLLQFVGSSAALVFIGWLVTLFVSKSFFVANWVGGALALLMTLYAAWVIQVHRQNGE